MKALRDETPEYRQTIIDALMRGDDTVERWDLSRAIWVPHSAKDEVDLNNMYRLRPEGPRYYRYCTDYVPYPYMILHPDNNAEYLMRSENLLGKKSQLRVCEPNSDWIPCDKEEYEAYRVKLLPDTMYLVWRSGTNVLMPYMLYHKNVGVQGYDGVNHELQKLVTDEHINAEMLRIYDELRNDSSSVWRLATREEYEKYINENATEYFIVTTGDYNPGRHYVYAIKFVGNEAVESVGSKSLEYARGFSKPLYALPLGGFRKATAEEYAKACQEVKNYNERKEETYFVRTDGEYCPSRHSLYAVKFVGDKVTKAVGGYTRDDKDIVQFANTWSKDKYVYLWAKTDAAGFAKACATVRKYEETQKMQRAYDESLRRMWVAVPKWANFVHYGAATRRWHWSVTRPDLSNGTYSKVTITDAVFYTNSLGEERQTASDVGMIPTAYEPAARPDGVSWTMENSLLVRP